MMNKQLQKLMDEVYDIYDKHKGDRNTIETLLSKQHCVAVMFGNLNAQVNNGGFSQWWENGYGKDLEELLVLTQRGIDQNLECFQELHDILESISKIDPIENRDAYETCSECNGSGEDPYVENDCCDECGGSGEIYANKEENWYEEIHVHDEQYYALSQDKLFSSILAFINRLGEQVEPKPKLPKKPTVKLTGTEGDALSVVATVSKALKKNNYSKDDLDRFRKEALSGDYNKVLTTAMKWVEVI